MKGKIYITITPDGVKIDVKGIEGKSCLDLTAPLEEAIEGEKKTKLTREYYLETNKNRLKQKW